MKGSEGSNPTLQMKEGWKGRKGRTRDRHEEARERGGMEYGGAKRGVREESGKGKRVEGLARKV